MILRGLMMSPAEFAELDYVFSRCCINYIRAIPHNAARADTERKQDSDDGTFSQEYFVYCKKKWLNQIMFYPADAADVLCGVALD